MADETNDTDVASQRRRIGSLMIAGAFWVIGASGVILIGGLIWLMIVIANRSTDAVSPEDFAFVFDHIERFISSIIPLFGAWVGAVIAFYFARDNFDAATENTRKLLDRVAPVDLTAISAEETMVPLSKVTFARVGDDDALVVKTDILKRFKDKGLGRVVVLDGEDHGVGVLHDSYITDFLLDPPATITKNADQITFADLIKHERTQELLQASVVYVTPDATLAAVREAMAKASRSAPRSVRDGFVTPGGRKTEAILGYLSDLDIAKRGKLAG